MRETINEAVSVVLYYSAEKREAIHDGLAH
jgi:hypothetical protein